MTEDIRKVCENIAANRPRLRREPMLDGYGGSLYLDKNEQVTKKRFRAV